MNRRSFFQMISAFVPVVILSKLAPEPYKCRNWFREEIESDPSDWDSALGYIGSRQQYFGPLSVEEQIEKDAMRDMAKHIERLYLG